MNNLIKNEFIKIFKKKSLWITGILIIVIIIASNLITKFSNNSSSENYYSDYYKQYIDEEVAKLNPNTASDNAAYIELKTIQDVITLSNKYKSDDWQQEVIETYLQTAIKEKNTYQYGLEKEEEKLKEAQSKYDEMVQKLDRGEWKYFVEEDLKNVEAQLDLAKQSKENTVDKMALSQIERQIKTLEIQKQTLNWRLEKNIEFGYGDNYFNQAIKSYLNSATSCLDYESNLENLTYEEKQQYQNELRRANLYRYDIENNTKTQESQSARGILMQVFNNYEIFIILIIVMVAGVMISEEFNKGTIKLLLVRPYSRNKMLLSKLITSILMIFIATLFVIGVQSIVGGFVFGFDSMTLPIIEYSFETNQIITMNMVAYLGIMFLCKLPIYILITTLAFALSTLTTNSPLAIAVPLLGYMGSNMINMLGQELKLKWITLFVTPNWDLSQYLFGGLPIFENMNLWFSILVCAIYFIIMLIPTFLVFRKRNIKNV